jgi:hypothetical protein
MQKMTHHVILATSWDATAQPDLPTEVELRDFREEPFAQILRFVLANFSERRRRVPLLHPRSTKASGVCALARTARTQHYQFAPALRIGANPSLADLRRHHLSPSDLPGSCSSFRGGLFTCVSSRVQAQGKFPLSASPANSASLTILYGEKESRASDTKQPGIQYFIKDSRRAVREDSAAL